MIIRNNWLFIKPDADFNALKGGVEVVDYVDGHLQHAVTGRVLQVPLYLLFRKPGRSRSETRREINGKVQFRSLEFDCPMELSVGDRVLFKYHARLDLDEYDSIGRDFFISYDMLYARIDGESLYPLNGYIFVSPVEDSDNYGNPLVIGKGRVEAVGKPLRNYLWFDFKDRDNVKVGDFVYFYRRKAVRIEYDYYAQYGGLMRIQRKDVLMSERNEPNPHRRSGPYLGSERVSSKNPMS